MSLIPPKIYGLVESTLRSRDTLVPRAEMGLYKAQAAARSADSSWKKRETAARVLAWEKKLENARKWLDVIRLLERVFPENTQEGRIARLMYQDGMSLNQAAHSLCLRRQTAGRKRDNYVVHAALFAAAAGLIRVREDE